MKITALSLLTVLSATAAFAAFDDTTYIFSTKGPDCYADGTQVAVGERYALVWSAGEFAGFKADGTLVNASDAVLGIFSLATTQGNCPLCSFGVPSSVVSKGGYISLWLLDTRKFAADGKVTFSELAADSKSVASVAGAVKTAADITVSGAGVKNSAGDASVAAQTALPADAPKPTIKGFRVESGLAYVTVENTAPYLSYDLSAGEQPNQLEGGKAKNPVTGGGEITLISEAKGNSQFFQVNRK